VVDHPRQGGERHCAGAEHRIVEALQAELVAEGGLGAFALNAGLGISPALFSFAMVQTDSVVMGTVYGVLNTRFP
jgi:hypothetical protein